MKEKEKEVEKIKANYKLQTTIVFNLNIGNDEKNQTDISGSISRNVFNLFDNNILFIYLLTKIRMKSLII